MTIPYQISEQIAENVWNQNKEMYQSQDIIIITDTVALSYIFLRHLNELKPHLIIVNCNRFTYGMEHNHNFIQLLENTQKKQSCIDKVTYIPYTTFERIWCGKHKISVYEQEINPIGRYDIHFNDKNHVISNFKELNTSYKMVDTKDTFFIQSYGNHINFMNLAAYLYDNGISSVVGGYENINDLQEYKALVVLPDQFSKYFTFESIQSKLLILLPSPHFLMELVQKPGYYFNIEGSSGRLTNEFTNLCEWYKYPECRIYFDSFEELVDIIKNQLTDEKLELVNKYMDFYRDTIHDENMLKWSNILKRINLFKIARE